MLVLMYEESCSNDALATGQLTQKLVLHNPAGLCMIQAKQPQKIQEAAPGMHVH